MTLPSQDFVRVLRTLWRLLRWMMWGSLALVLLIFAGQTYNMYAMFSAWHPALGWLFLAAAAALVWWLIGMPILRFLHMPVALRPPELPPREQGLHATHLERHVKFICKYLQRQRRNSFLADHVDKIDTAIETGQVLAGAIKTRGDEGLDESLRQVELFRRQQVDPILLPLDEEAERIIRTEALGVGVATAVSLNGTLDALIVLWRNVNMVSRLARVYYGRPGPRGSLLILRDVSTVVLISNYLDNLTDTAGNLLGKWLGGIAAVVAGPLLNGGANAVMTLRLGYLARARCRSMQRWTDEHRRSVLMRALKSSADASTWVLREMTSQVGGIVGGVVGGMASGAAGAGATVAKGIQTIRDLFLGAFRRESGDPGESAT
ncbi:YcjF family protein [Candidatus Sumerlaeota bacterium]|nr:YcjF family protein [Candidatus Sumerlaeota bacterium]